MAIQFNVTELPSPYSSVRQQQADDEAFWLTHSWQLGSASMKASRAALRLARQAKKLEGLPDNTDPAARRRELEQAQLLADRLDASQEEVERLETNAPNPGETWLGKAGQWASSVVGSTAPYMTEFALAAGTTLAMLHPAARLAKIAAASLPTAAIRKSAVNAAVRAVGRKRAVAAARRAAATGGLKGAAVVGGGVFGDPLGVGTGFYEQYLGDIVKGKWEGGVQPNITNRDKAYALAAAGLNTVPLKTVVGRLGLIGKPAERVAGKVMGQARRLGLRSPIASGAIAIGGREAATEAMQEMLILNALKDSGVSVTPDRMWEAFWQSAAAGAFMGGLMGAGTAAISRPRAAPPQATPAPEAASATAPQQPGMPAPVFGTDTGQSPPAVATQPAPPLPAQQQQDVAKPPPFTAQERLEAKERAAMETYGFLFDAKPAIEPEVNPDALVPTDDGKRIVERARRAIEFNPASREEVLVGLTEKQRKAVLRGNPADEREGRALATMQQGDENLSQDNYKAGDTGMTNTREFETWTTQSYNLYKRIPKKEAGTTPTEGESQPDGDSWPNDVAGLAAKANQTPPVGKVGKLPEQTPAEITSSLVRLDEETDQPALMMLSEGSEVAEVGGVSVFVDGSQESRALVSLVNSTLAGYKAYNPNKTLLVKFEAGEGYNNSNGLAYGEPTADRTAELLGATLAEPTGLGSATTAVVRVSSLLRAFGGNYSKAADWFVSQLGEFVEPSKRGTFGNSYLTKPMVTPESGDRQIFATADDDTPVGVIRTTEQPDLPAGSDDRVVVPALRAFHRMLAPSAPHGQMMVIYTDQTLGQAGRGKTLRELQAMWHKGVMYIKALPTMSDKLMDAGDLTSEMMMAALPAIVHMDAERRGISIKSVQGSLARLSKDKKAFRNALATMLKSDLKKLPKLRETMLSELELTKDPALAAIVTALERVAAEVSADQYLSLQQDVTPPLRGQAAVLRQEGELVETQGEADALPRSQALRQMVIQEMFNYKVLAETFNDYYDAVVNMRVQAGDLDVKGKEKASPDKVFADAARCAGT